MCSNVEETGCATSADTKKPVAKQKPLETEVDEEFSSSESELEESVELKNEHEKLGKRKIKPVVKNETKLTLHGKGKKRRVIEGTDSKLVKKKNSATDRKQGKPKEQQDSKKSHGLFLFP